MKGLSDGSFAVRRCTTKYCPTCLRPPHSLSIPPLPPSSSFVFAHTTTLPPPLFLLARLLVTAGAEPDGIGGVHLWIVHETSEGTKVEGKPEQPPVSFVQALGETDVLSIHAILLSRHISPCSSPLSTSSLLLSLSCFHLPSRISFLSVIPSLLFFPSPPLSFLPPHTLVPSSPFPPSPSPSIPSLNLTGLPPSALGPINTRSQADPQAQNHEITNT